MPTSGTDCARLDASNRAWGSSQAGSMPRRVRRALCAAIVVWPALAAAAGVSVRFDVDDPGGSPFPSDRFTRPDWAQRTFKRVKLPKPDCAVRPSDCADIDVINTLDGFNTQPRITVPFTGAIDPGSVNSDRVFLVNLGDTLSSKGSGRKVGINQVVWDVASKTLVFESDELLNEHSRYLLVVTTGVRDAAGDPIEAGRFGRFERDWRHGRDDRRHQRHDRDRDGDGDDDDDDDDGRDIQGYHRTLRDAVHASGVNRSRIAALSVFTTQTATADLRKIHRQIRHSRPAPVDFMIGDGGTSRAVFATASLAGIQFTRQVGTASFRPSFLPTPALNVIPGAVAGVAFGKFRSPDYQDASKVIPATPTLTGHPRALSSNDLVFELFVPSAAKPAGGWPVAIFGHGFTDSMYGAPWTVASVFASHGIATIAINVVGHGGGAQGTLTVLPTAGAPVVLPAGGRGIDQDGNGSIDSTEGVNAAPPQTIVGSRDGLRQTVVDLMQLVRQIEVGIDVDGDGHADLDSSRIYYAGQSFGGIYGTILLGAEDGIKAGAPNVPGGSITEVARLGLFRPLTGLTLLQRQPGLLNLPPTPALPVPLNFFENIPLRDAPAVVNDVAGASAIQLTLDRLEWVQQSGNPVSYAPYIRKDPPRGHAAKPVLYQFAKGDVTVPNPTTSAILRAGDLADTATFFRNDLAFAANPAVQKDPHTFLTNIGDPAAAAFAVGAQTQIAIFFASGGSIVIDPDGPLPLFEVPVVLPLPESLSFLP
jgi:Bacterial Ig-like domain